MKNRCLNSATPGYWKYGARGIRVCERWERFENFLIDMGERPPGTSLDRIDNDGNYEPGNCRWATAIEQGNNKRSNRSITFDGRTLTATQWEREMGYQKNVVLKRIHRGETDPNRLLAQPRGFA